MTRQTIRTDQAPAAIGPYSQAVRAGRTVYLSGQIPLDPHSMELVSGEIEAQARAEAEARAKELEAKLKQAGLL